MTGTEAAVWTGSWTVYLLSGGLWLQYCMRFYTDHRIGTANYKGIRIPAAGGLFVWGMCLLYTVLYEWLGTWAGEGRFSEPIPLTSFLLVVTIVFVAGLLDDLVGDVVGSKGFRGHFRMWRQHQIVTTGALKAIIIGIASLLFVIVSGRGIADGLAGWIMLMFSANLMNLLDVRPGRALKAGLAAAFGLLLAGGAAPVLLYLFPVVAAMLWLFPMDLAGKVMLGDAGSNPLGIALGMCAALTLPVWGQWLVALMLVMLNVGAEAQSLSERIDANPLLRWLDRLGRQ